MSELCPVAVMPDPNLKDEPQPETVLDSHLLLLKQKRLCDVIFTFPNSTEQIEAHQLYLRERSPVFDLIFRTPKPSATEGSKREVEIAESTPARFLEFLEFIYAEKFQVGIAGALDLLHLALKYKVEPLKKKCETLIKTEVKIDDALEVFETAYHYGKHDLIGKAGNLLVKHLGTLLVKLTEAQEFTLNYLLSRDDLTVKECDLFQFLLNWGKNRPCGDNDLKGVLKNLIALIRFPCMTPHEFTTIVVPSGLLSAEETLQIYSFFGRDPAARSEIGKNINFPVTPRKAETVAKSVDFNLNVIGLGSHRGIVPLKECISFLVKIGHNASPKVWCEFSIQRPSIKRIFIRWPYRKVRKSIFNSEHMNFKVALKWCVGTVQDNNVEEKFSVVLRERTAGKEEEVIVDPPIELINGIKYCITVEDLSGHSRAPVFNSKALKNETVEYTYWAFRDYSRIKQSPIINLEKWPVELRDIDENKNLTGFGNYPRFHVVTGVGIALV